jgi:hypothetical protein
MYAEAIHQKNILKRGYNMSIKVTDYHDFVDKHTPKKERRRLNTGDIYINAATCKICGEHIRSKNRHDYVTCKCGNLSVDGGSWYAKRGFRKSIDSFINDIVYFSDVKEKLEEDSDI